MYARTRPLVPSVCVCVCVCARAYVSVCMSAPAAGCGSLKECGRVRRYLYDEFMGRAGTRQALDSGNVLSILNCLMQLRKVCAHPDLFEPRPVTSPLVLPSLAAAFPAQVVLEADPHGAPLARAPACILLSHADDDVHSLPAPHRGVEERSASLDAPLHADAAVQRLVARVEAAHPAAAADLMARVRAWTTGPPITPWPSRDAARARPRPVRQRLMLTLGPAPSWARIVAMPPRPADSVHTLGPSAHVRQYASCSSAPSALFTVYPILTMVLCLFVCLCAPLAPCFSLCLSVFCTLTHSHTHTHTHSLSLCRYWATTSALVSLVLSWAERAAQEEERVRTFLCVIAPVTAPPPLLRVTTTRRPWRERAWDEARAPWSWLGDPSPPNQTQSSTLATPAVAPLPPGDAMMHGVRTAMAAFFPDKHLLQFDCGKLQALASLLRTLHAGGHRVLIFSQMTRMLDILETFLSVQGYRYTRLDGATGLERRQYLVERFNADARLFVFLLSTRSGGVGVNLTGADAVIFYDSDWNPAMDAQAQDRCHRIGQTRDVHVYRLVTAHTIEENILRKADQKRAMDAMVIGDGAFTVDFFRQLDVRELFGDGAGGASASASASAGAVGARVLGGSSNDVERAMAAAEDADDVAALRQAQQESLAATDDVNDFAEQAPTAGGSSSVGVGEGGAAGPAAAAARAQALEDELMTRLRPVERWAVRLWELLPTVTLVSERRPTARVALSARTPMVPAPVATPAPVPMVAEAEGAREIEAV
jgi:hypothetical protein